MNKETISVINFLQSNVGIVQQYFDGLRGGDMVSYSDMMSSGVISGTTEDGVDLNSSKVTRCEVTAYLLEKYSEQAIREV